MRTTHSVRHAYDEKSNERATVLSFLGTDAAGSDGATLSSYTNRTRKIIRIAAFVTKMPNLKIVASPSPCNHGKVAFAWSIAIHGYNDR
jgi:hypothetical protein